MPRLRPIRLPSSPKLELVRLSGDDGWHFGVLDDRKEVGRLAHVRAGSGEWCGAFQTKPRGNW
jgi:hypothetical protein